MASVKVILRANKINKQGKAPLYLQLIHDRKTKEISLKKYIKPKYWNKQKSVVRQTHPNSSPINVSLNNEIRAYEKIINTKIALSENFTLNDVVDIKNGKITLHESNALDTTLVFQFEEFIKNPPSSITSVNSLKAYSSCLFHLKKFDKTILIKKINKTWMDRFIKYLKSKGNKINTSADKVKVLKSVLNKLVRDEKIPSNPLKGYKRQTEPSKREFLTKEELIMIQNYKPKTKSKTMVKDIFLFGCYTGLRFSDICTLKRSDIREDYDGVSRIYFQMNKTGDILNMKLADYALKICNMYKIPHITNVFSILDFSKDLSSDENLKKEISRRNAYFNKVLKEIILDLEIEKKITFHCSRHTFATLSIGLGIPIEVVSKLLGHKNIQETQIYARILDKQKDVAIDIWNSLN